MPGGGTKLATTPSNPPPARLLDITRLISRAGRVLTGVDRVELAYFRHLTDRPEPFFAIARTTFGYILLNRSGAGEILSRIEGRHHWGPQDRLSRFARKTPALTRRAESDLRRFALDRCRPGGLGRMLARHLPFGTAYLNTGHSNLTDRMLWAVKHGAKGIASVLLHDCIPLDFPQFQRPGTPEKFRAMLKRVRASADLIICNSAHTRDSVVHHMSNWGEVPDMVVAPLGVEPATPAEVPPQVAVDRPYFVSLGTIEPRKGHDLLLDVWDAFGDHPETPGLLICGNRGWNNEAVFERLDNLGPNGPVQELNGLDDGQVAALLVASEGLLFPSRAEGFGLPAVEAAALGVPVLSANLPSVRDVLGDWPIYVEEYSVYQWKTAIEQKLKSTRQNTINRYGADFSPPSWQEHFNAVLRIT